jgi:hypothetical protein
VEVGCNEMGFTSWNEATGTTKDRPEWRGLVHGPILHREKNILSQKVLTCTVKCSIVD